MPDDLGPIGPSEQPPEELEERGGRLDEDDERLLAQLHQEFTELQPGADIEIFEGRAQAALGQAKAITAQALIHWLAAEAMGRAGEEKLAEAINRALDHVERARSALLGLSTALYNEIGGPIAMSRARLRVNLEHATREDVAATVEACEEAVGLVSADTSSETVGALAYNAAFLLLSLDPSPAPDTPVFRRAAALFRAALDRYEAAGMGERAADAAENLAVFALRRLETAPVGTAERRDVFDEAWRLAERAMTEVGTTTNAAVWARRNELAAAIVRMQPGKSEESNVGDAIKYLDRALLRYQVELMDSDSAARCAHEILGLLDTLPAPWPSATAIRYVTYLDARAGHSTAPAPDRSIAAAQAIAAGGAWAKVADDPVGRSLRIREYGERALAYAEEAGDNLLCAMALILLGNDRLDPAPQPDGGEAVRLAEACDLFERAVTCARNCRNAALEGQALRRLGVALARRLSEHDEIQVLDRTVEVLRQAAAASQGGERARAVVNIANLLLWEAQRQGSAVPVEAIKRTIDEVEALAAADPDVAQAVARLQTALDEVVVLDRMSSVRFESLPASLGYRLYRTEEKALEDTGLVEHVVTILVTPDQAVATDGAMQLAESNDEVSAEIEMACPACGAKQHVSVPIIASLEKTERNEAHHVQRMARGDLRCTSCGMPIIVQSTFALDRGVQGGWLIVFPDALGPGGGIIKQQAEVISQLHRAWKGELLDVAGVVPWAGILAFGIRAATAVGIKRTLDVGAIVFGLLNRQIDKVRAGLEGCLQSVSADELVRGEEISAAVLAAMTVSGAPDLDRYATEAVTEQVNSLIGKARTLGLEAVMARVGSGFADSSAKAAEMDAALLTAADGDSRRKLLRRYLREAPDYGSDREHALSNFFFLGAELEMQSLRDRGIDKSDPKEYARASSRFALMRQLADERMAEDRRRNSAAPGKALLDEALGENRPFVLLLRAFTVDVPVGRPSEVVRKLTDRFGDARIDWNVFTIMTDNSGRSAHRVVEWLAPYAPLLMVVNAVDPNPPERAAKLYMTDPEWRSLVFPLIGEAAVIVLVLPPEHQSLPDGVIDELGAINRLGRKADTVIVLADPAGVLDFSAVLTENASPAPSATPVSPEALRDWGFGVVLREQEVAANPNLLVEAVMARLKS